MVKKKYTIIFATRREKCSDKREIFCKIKVRTLSGDGKITGIRSRNNKQRPREVDREGGGKEGREKGALLKALSQHCSALLSPIADTARRHVCTVIYE